MGKGELLLLVKVLAGISVLVAAGWFISFVVVPIVDPDYKPAPEVAAVMTAVITAITGLLGTAYFKVKRLPDDPADDVKDEGPGGDSDAQ